MLVLRNDMIIYLNIISKAVELVILRDDYTKDIYQSLTMFWMREDYITERDKYGDVAKQDVRLVINRVENEVFIRTNKYYLDSDKQVEVFKSVIERYYNKCISNNVIDI